MGAIQLPHGYASVWVLARRRIVRNVVDGPPWMKWTLLALSRGCLLRCLYWTHFGHITKTVTAENSVLDVFNFSPGAVAEGTAHRKLADLHNSSAAALCECPPEDLDLRMASCSSLFLPTEPVKCCSTDTRICCFYAGRAGVVLASSGSSRSVMEFR